ncbi:MAG TPA: hypothetical protein VLT62_03185 [Candidatus Methylomirabilis sp.]|nr:hypothetical protein [Candidatus Methylomirabilis sp.]
MLTLILITLLLGAFYAGAGLAGNIDPGDDGSRYAYGENIGWVNFKPSSGNGVTVDPTAITGYAWGENIGWLNLSPPGGGVVNDGAGRLSGYAWGENTGWVNFDPPGGGVVIDTCGDFGGTAWGENVGWVTFQATSPVPFKVRTAWIPPDVIPPATSASGAGAGWSQTDVTLTLIATDNACGAGVKELHTLLDSNPEVITPGPTASTTITTEGSHTFRYFAVDQAANPEPAHVLPIRIDKTPPLPNMTSPVSGAIYVINQAVPASFAATDALSGVAALTGTVPNGAPITTATPGTQTFTVSATDQAGNSATTTRAYTVVYPGNITPTSPNPGLAWGENVGWLNFKPGYGPGVTVSASALTGRLWSENLGWITLNPPSGGVVNDGAGHLSGYAWGENVGWINFKPTGGGVSINGTTGQFSGYAWGENIGWINLAPTGGGVTTTLPDTTPPTIVHTPVTSWAKTTPLTITATITDNAGVQGAILFYRPTGASSYASLVMGRSGSTYSATITVTPPGLQYYLEARDTANNLARPPGNGPTTPYNVVVGTSVFADDPLVAKGTPIKALHLTQLRTAINNLRARCECSLAPIQWTDPSLAAGSTPVKRVHLGELRAALDEVYAKKGQSPPAYTDLTITARQTVIKAAHLNELRTFVRALE